MLFDYKNAPKGFRAKKVLNYNKIAGRKSEDVDIKSKTLYQDMHKLGWELTKTCIENNGIGLAAPQIGVYKNVFITVGFVRPHFWSFDGYFHMFINPTIKIKKSWGETPCGFTESCLSIPGEKYTIQRMQTISTEYYYFDKNKKLKKSMDQLTGYQSRIFQHEYDHLVGTNIIELYEQQNRKRRRGRPPKATS